MNRPIAPSFADAAALALRLDRNAATPLAWQLARQLGALILAGRIGSGAQLPASRSLAADLAVSRATVVEAYEQLVAEGYLQGRRGAGMFVASRLVRAEPTPTPESEPAAAPEGGPARAFRLGAVAADVAPFAEFARGLQRAWMRPDARALTIEDPFGLADLRAAIAAHLSQWRGFAPSPARLVVTAGLADALDIVARSALPSPASALVEDPGHAPLRDGLARLGVKVVPVAVDDEGFDIAQAPPGEHHAAFVTPSRQFPLGAALPIARRLALVDWARGHDALIVEDDFDSEYRYIGAPLPALASLGGEDHVVYVGSFSKVLFSGLRLGFVVLPARFIAPARAYLTARGPLASTLAQPALAEFIASGRYGAHIRRSRRLYARRLAALLGEAERLRPWLRFGPAEAGLHVVADLAPAFSARIGDREVAAALRAGGVWAAPLSYYYAGPPRRAGLALGFAGFSEREITHAARRMAEILAQL